jgi:Zn-dependent protease/CBS domain-containing protein
MTWRWRLGELFGIVIYMHATFLLLIGWVALVPILSGAGAAGALHAVLFILLLFACVVAHEYGHALTARRFGIRTRDITLLPIGGVARLERMPRDPAQELWVALAGPAVTAAIAVVLYVLGYALAGAGFNRVVGLMSPVLLGQLAATNVVILLFNLLPAFPMDGGRVLRALLAQRMEYVRATRLAANVGQLMAFLMGFAGLLFGQPFLLFIALFVYMGAEAEAQMVQVQESFRGLPVWRAMMTRFATLGAEDPLSRAVQFLLSDSQQDFPVLDGERVVGLLTRRNLLTALHEQGTTARVADAMQRDIVPVDAEAPLEKTFQQMQTEALSALPVTELGKLTGLLTMENIAELLMVRSALDGAPRPPGQMLDAAGAARERPAWSRRRGVQM